MIRNQLTTWLLAASFSVSLLAACGDTAPGENAALPGGTALPDDFKAFYAAFHADSAFQMEHIMWPLAGNVRADSSGTRRDLRYRAADWTLHRPLDAEGFTREFNQVREGLIEETIRAETGNYAILRRWGYHDDAWRLTYYRSSELGDG